MTSYCSLTILLSFLLSVGGFAQSVGAKPLSHLVYSDSLLKDAKLLGIIQGKYIYKLETAPFRDSTIKFVQPLRAAKEEMVLNGIDLSVNHIALAHTSYVGVNGSGLTVSIKENLPDTSDIDFFKRFRRTNSQANIVTTHATAMTTLVAGAGNNYYNGLGVAPRARITSASFASLEPEAAVYYDTNLITVQNHSYGTAIENFYGADAALYDLSVINKPQLLHVFSSGNSGNQPGTNGLYASVQGFSNITGSFKMSKNSIAVGGTDRELNILPLSSRGPAYDGRIKPEIVAYGLEGTSGAAALVSGAGLLVQQYHRDKYGSIPPASLVKSMLLCSATDVGSVGPGYSSGFGSLNLDAALSVVRDGRFAMGSIGAGEVKDHIINVAADAGYININLCWTDPPAQPNSPGALINDLNLEVRELSTGNLFLPWILSRQPVKDSLALSAIRGVDSINNVEQVGIALPAGMYSIKVKGAANLAGVQDYSLSWYANKNGQFEFTWPAKDATVQAGASNIVRWQNTMNATAGDLAISYDRGTSWQFLSAVQLDKGYLTASFQDTISVGLLRMTISGANFYSDTFVLTKRIPLSVGYYCKDSFLLHWPKEQGISHYHVRSLNDTTSSGFVNTVDTSVVVYKPVSTYFSVAAFNANRQLQRSYAFDPGKQGVGCYINSFLADLTSDSTVKLSLVLGSKYNISKVTIRRTYKGTKVQEFSSIADSLVAYDRLTNGGVHYYNAVITFDDGRQMFGDTVQVVLFKATDYFVYPNPVASGQTIVVQSRDYEKATFNLFNSLGQVVFSRRLRTDNEMLQLPNLSSGIYFYSIKSDLVPDAKGKLIVR